MKAYIVEQLRKIEQEKGIKILHVCETGSRAWGFHSPDSDYDVRFIYVHEQDWYLSLNERKDSIERMLDDGELDITGWELRKAMRLLWKSNAPLLERLQSPIIYHQEEKFVTELRKVGVNCYSRIATLHHYLSMCKKYYHVVEESPCKLKRLFYALRTAAVCQWILRYDTVPPIEFKKVVAGLDLDTVLMERINALLEIKAHENETYLHAVEEKLVLEFIQSTIAESEQLANTLPPGNGNMEEINDLFQKTVKQPSWT